MYTRVCILYIIITRNSVNVCLLCCVTIILLPSKLQRLLVGDRLCSCTCNFLTRLGQPSNRSFFLSQSLTFLVRFRYIKNYYFRGDYFCAPKQFGKFFQTQLDFGIPSYFGNRPFNIPKAPSYEGNQAFPGYFDRGSPLIIEEEGQQTVIGLSKEQENSNRDRPNIFHKIHPDAFRWIVKHAEAHDSNCESFTSCSCGIPGKPLSTSLGKPTHPHQELRR